MIDTEPPCPDRFKFKDQVEVIKECSRIATIATHPKGGLYTGPDAGQIHVDIIIGCP
jgi:hypothetical protein